MNSFITIIAALISVFPLVYSQSCAPYNTVGVNHTMCIYPPNSGCPKYSRGATQADIDDILKTHNTLRQTVANGQQQNQPSASNMREMKWNSELAEIAQRWADQCTFGHDANRNTPTYSWVGQNVAAIWYSANVTGEANFKDHAINLWFNEVAKFNASNIDPFVFTSDTGHYTQVVWANSGDVGCGYAYYGAYNKLYVCNYGPGGNVIGTSMYKKGTPCSQCAAGCSTTYPGLCKN